MIENTLSPLAISEQRETYMRDDGTTFTRKDIYLKLFVTFRDSMLKRLKGPKLSVFLCVALHCNETMTSYPSIATIEEETGYSRQAVIDSIKELEEMGMISIAGRSKEDGSQNSNLYTIKGYAGMGGVVNQVDYGSQPGRLGVVYPVDPKKNHTKKNQLRTSEAQTAKPQNPPAPPEPARPSGTEVINSFFGDKAPTQEPRKAVDLTNTQSRADYADRLHEQRRARATNEPWLALYDWVPAPRNGVSRDTLRHVAHVFVSAGVPEPMSDSARKEWKSALSNVYIEAGSERTWEIIQAAAVEVAGNLQYNPPHRWVQAIINIKAQKQRVSADSSEGRRGRLVSVAQ